MSSRAQQSGVTRAKLLRVARELFARHGYNDVATEEIVRRAGVTRGALYHHFRDKRDLFQAVVEQIEQEVLQKVAETALSEADPWDQQSAAIRAYLEWRWRAYQAAHPDVEMPKQVILHVRVYRIPPPPGERPWKWDGPVDRPMARWRPHVHYITGAPPIEVYDLIAQRYDMLP